MAPFRRDPGRAAVLCDFDGTLAPIVDDPDAARPLPGAVDLLHRLAARYRVVAVISGRPLAFLRSHLARPPLTLVGLYGLERSAAGGDTLIAPEAEAWRAAIEATADTAERELPPMVEIERKGLAVTLHVRRHPEQAATAAAWAEQAAATRGLGMHAGRMSWELRPPIRADKGTTVEELAAGCTSVCFVGDDVGDLPAFAALDRLRAGGAHTLKVAVRSDEAPEAMLDNADLIVDGPPGALELLARLDG